MGFNFRKSFKIAPGIRLNVGKKGISSVSVGKNGARVSIGKKGTRTTVGLPGTGLSYSKFHSHTNRDNPPSSLEQNKKSIGFGTLIAIGFVVLLFFIWIFG